MTDILATIIELDKQIKRLKESNNVFLADKLENIKATILREHGKGK